jgi:hypothetical protein
LYSDVLRRSTLLVTEPLVLVDEQSDPGETGRRRTLHTRVEVAESRAAEM